MFKLYCYIICVLLLIPAKLTAGTIDPINKDQEYIDYGVQHKCVLQVQGTMQDKDATTNKPIKYSASCVVISPRWAITAAHVLNRTESRYVIHNNEKIEILIGIIPEDFIHSKFGKCDIALCYLDKPVFLDFYPGLYEGRDEIGKVNSQAGYGATGNFISGITKEDGLKRAGSNIVDHIEEDILVCSANEADKTSLEFLIARGDSGGGLFIDQKLAGIHSCVFSKDGKADSDYGDSSGHTRISIFKDWIQETISKIEKLDDE